MFLQGWVNGILINESSVYGTLCIVLLKILNMGLYFSEIDTRDWPYRRQDLLLPFNHSFNVQQTMMDWSPGCYIPSFVEIGQPVPEKKIFEGFLPYMGVVAILVM